MKEYNTKQKESLLAFLKENNHKSFTADELTEMIPSVGKSTLYRLLSHLEEEGMVTCSLKGRSRTYSYRKDECLGHLHLLCTKCGRYIHLSREASVKIIAIIRSDAGFDASRMDWEIRGVCSRCRG